eukprot:6199096-Pleurochrysis_carterae.AAC.2
MPKLTQEHSHTRTFHWHKHSRHRVWCRLTYLSCGLSKEPRKLTFLEPHRFSVWYRSLLAPSAFLSYLYTNIDANCGSFRHHLLLLGGVQAVQAAVRAAVSTNLPVAARDARPDVSESYAASRRAEAEKASGATLARAASRLTHLLLD